MGFVFKFCFNLRKETKSLCALRRNVDRGPPDLEFLRREFDFFDEVLALFFSLLQFGLDFLQLGLGLESLLDFELFDGFTQSQVLGLGPLRAVLDLLSALGLALDDLFHSLEEFDLLLLLSFLALLQSAINAVDLEAGLTHAAVDLV